MNIETKFNFGERVYSISEGSFEAFIPCETCEGSGRITTTTGKSFQCPSCYGRKGEQKWINDKWAVDYDSILIQKIGVEMYNPNNKRHSSNRSWIYYMEGSSGTMHDEARLFKTKEDAQLECDKRNSVQP